MPRSCVRAIPLVTVTALAVILAGCAAPTASPAVTPSSTLIASPTAVATPNATQSPEPTPDATQAATQRADGNTFVSPRYKYALTLPPGSLVVGWHAAERAWNGQAALESGGPYLDRTAIAEGGIHLFGAPSASLEEWFGTVEGNGIRSHRCTKAQNRRDASIGGAQAIAFTQVCGGGSEIWVRVAIFKDGYGIGLWLHPTPGAEIAGRDRALELLKGLEWRTG